MTETISFDDLWQITGTASCVEYCEHKEDGPFFFHSQCHIDKPTWVKFEPEEGMLVVLCAVCEKEIVRISR